MSRPTAQDKAHAIERITEIMNSAAFDTIYVHLLSFRDNPNGGTRQYSVFAIHKTEGYPMHLGGYMCTAWGYRRSDNVHITGNFYADSITDHLQAVKTERDMKFEVIR